MRIIGLIMLACSLATPSAAQVWSFDVDNFDSQRWTYRDDPDGRHVATVVDDARGTSLVVGCLPGEVPQLILTDEAGVATDGQLIPAAILIDGNVVTETNALVYVVEGHQYNFQESIVAQDTMRTGDFVELILDGTIVRFNLAGSHAAITHVWDRC